MVKSALHSMDIDANNTILELRDQIEEIVTADNVNLVIYLAVNYLQLQPIVDTLKNAVMNFMMDGVTEEGIDSLISNFSTELGEVVRDFVNVTRLSETLLTRIDNFGQSIFGPQAAFANYDEFFDDMLEISVNGLALVLDSVADQVTQLIGALLQMFLTEDIVTTILPFYSMAALTFNNPFLLNMMIDNFLNQTATFALGFVEDESIDSNVDFIMARVDAAIQIFINPETIQANQELYTELKTKLFTFILTSDDPFVERIFYLLSSAGIFS